VANVTEMTARFPIGMPGDVGYGDPARNRELMSERQQVAALIEAVLLALGLEERSVAWQDVRHLLSQFERAES
jgi:hypothetical protein